MLLYYIPSVEKISSTVKHARFEKHAALFTELMHNRVIHAPLHNPDRILDIDCENGTVTHHLGLTYPE